MPVFTRISEYGRKIPKPQNNKAFEPAMLLIMVSHIRRIPEHWLIYRRNGSEYAYVTTVCEKQSILLPIRHAPYKANHEPQQFLCVCVCLYAGGDCDDSEHIFKLQHSRDFYARFVSRKNIRHLAKNTSHVCFFNARNGAKQMPFSWNESGISCYARVIFGSLKPILLLFCLTL